MSTTLKEMTYRIWRKLENGNIPDDTKYTYRELLGYVKSGIANGLKQSYFEQRNLEDYKYGDDSISLSYTETVKFDATKSLNYVDLKGKTISIAGNRFTTISPANEISRFSKSYIPIRKEEVLLRKLQPTIPCIVEFYKEDSKAYFINEEVPDKELLITQRYAIPTEDDLDMTMPEEFENQVMQGIIALILNIQIPADKANDGTTNN